MIFKSLAVAALHYNSVPIHFSCTMFSSSPTLQCSPFVSSRWQQRGGAGHCWCWGSFSSTSASERRRDTNFLCDLRTAEFSLAASPGGLWLCRSGWRKAAVGGVWLRDLRAAAAAINVDCLHRLVKPFLLPRLPATPSGRLGSAASPQIASVERSWWPWCWETW